MKAGESPQALPEPVPPEPVPLRSVRRRRSMRSGLGPARRCLWPGGAMSAPAMAGLARALRRAAAPGRLPAARRGGGGAGARPWGWGLALGLALGVRAAPAGSESDSGREEKPPSPRGFGAAVERSRDLVRRIKDEAGIPGILVGVSVDGKEVWSEGLGYADVENRVVCKPETVMRIASISKCLTMMAVAKLWEEGKLDLDAPVQKYVPEFPEKVYEGEKVTITTRQLVSHLSGIRHYEKDITKVKEEKEKANRALKLTKSHQDKEEKAKEGKGSENTGCVKQKKEHDIETKSRNSKPGRNDKEFEQEEYYLKEKFESVIESLKIFKNDPLFFKPGSQFLYSTYGFTLLSAVVERASGQKFTDYMLKMFRDLDMLSTVLDDNEAMIYNRARCYIYNKKGRLVNAPYVDNSYKWAGGGFLSSVGDLLKFGNALLYSYQAGQFKNKNGKLLPGYLKPSTVAMMWTPVPKTEVSWDRDGKYAMAWAVVEKNQQCGCCRQQRHYASHTGGAVGASSVLLILPEELDPEAVGPWPVAPPRGVIVTIICNMQSVSLNSTALKIAREFDREKQAQCMG